MLLTHRLEFVLNLLQPICEWKFVNFEVKILENVLEFKKIKKNDPKICCSLYKIYFCLEIRRNSQINEIFIKIHLISK